LFFFYASKKHFEFLTIGYDLLDMILSREERDTGSDGKSTGANYGLEENILFFLFHFF